MTSKKAIAVWTASALLLSGNTVADVFSFDFTGRLTVASSLGDILLNNGLSYTPIAASLTFDTYTGIGSSDLTISMNDPFLGLPGSLHDISMSNVGGSLIEGNVLVDWASNVDMPLHVAWDASGLFNAIGYGLQVGDTISGTDLIRGGTVIFDVGSSVPYADSLQDSVPGFQSYQGPAPLAATSASMGLADGTPFPGIRGYLDIGSGNSLHVTSITPSTVPVPAPIWLFASCLLAGVGFGRARRAGVD